MTLRQDLHIRQGATWSHTHEHKDAAGSAVDLTGYSARMAIKAGYEGSYEAYLSTGSDADGGTITLGGANGEITAEMTAEQTAKLAGDLSYFIFVRPKLRAERFVDFIYDLEIEAPDGTVTRVLEGNVTVQRETTS